MVPVEPISLAVGAVALASLFSLCVQCFDLIEVGRNLGPESELLVVKLSIEKRRLMIWGESVGILRPDSDRDPFLDESATRELVEQILGNIQKLFLEAESLRSKYGLEAVSSKPETSGATVDGSIACSNSFENSPIVQFQTKLSNHHSKLGFRAKTKWAIRDSKKFTALIQNPKDLLDGLSNITTSTSTVVLRGQLIRQETESISDLRTLKVIENTCSDIDWRSSASAASEYLGNMNRLTDARRGEISEWVSFDSHRPSEQSKSSPYKRQSQLDELDHMSTSRHETAITGIAELTSEVQHLSRLQAVRVLVLCSTLTLKAYLPSMAAHVNFHPVWAIPEVTPANKATAARMMKAVVVEPGITSPSITIYCPPRMRYVHMALSILDPMGQSPFRFQIRFDDRLLDEYTAVSTISKRMTGYYQDIEKASLDCDRSVRRIIDAVDSNWLEQRIEVLNTPNYVPPTNRLDWHTIFRQSRDDTSCVGIIIMAGEAACWDLFNMAPVTPPDLFKEGRVYRLRELDGTDSRSKLRWKAEHYCNVAVDSLWQT